MAPRGTKRKEPEAVPNPTNTISKRPARGYHKFKTDILDVTPGKRETEM